MRPQLGQRSLVVANKNSGAKPRERVEQLYCVCYEIPVRHQFQWIEQTLRHIRLKISHLTHFLQGEVRAVLPKEGISSEENIFVHSGIHARAERVGDVLKLIPEHPGAASIGIEPAKTHLYEVEGVVELRCVGHVFGNRPYGFHESRSPGDERL